MSSVMRSTCEGDPDVEATAEMSRSLKRDKFESDSYSDSYLEVIKLAMMSLFKNETKIDRIFNKTLHNLLDVDAPPFSPTPLLIGTFVTQFISCSW